MPGHREAQARLREFAEKVILDANTFLSALENNPNLRDAPPTGSLDPEDWVIMRQYAWKILDAIETDAYVDPAWIEAICKCAEKRQEPGP
jgi:hypothetical protein